MEFKHEPILKDEIIEFLRIKEDGNYLDCTIGGAGHSLAIISKLKNGHLYGIDKDIDALNVCKERLEGKGNFALIHDDFKNVEGIFKEHNLPNMDGVLIDASNSYRIAIQKTFNFFSGKEVSLEKIQEYKNLGGYNNDWILTEKLLLDEKIKIKIKYENIVEKFNEFYFGKDGDGFNRQGRQPDQYHGMYKASCRDLCAVSRTCNGAGQD